MRAPKDRHQLERVDLATEVLPAGNDRSVRATTLLTFGIFILDFSTVFAFSVRSPLLLSLYLHKYGHFVFEKGVKAIQ